jgi:predicted class III extradiol MEMO1 family dioxygenase
MTGKVEADGEIVETICKRHEKANKEEETHQRRVFAEDGALRR